MTPEEIAAKEQAEAEAAAAAEAAKKAAEDEATGSTSDIDYEAELKAERERREKAEKELAERAFQEREAKRKAKEAAGNQGEDEDKPLTAKELETILARERQETQKSLDSARIADMAKGMAGSDAEAKLIVEIHRNRTFPSGMPLQDQLEEAYIIANRKKIVAKNKELERALSGKRGVNDDAAGTHRDPTPGDEPKLNPNDAHAIKSAGMVWDGTKRMYKKPLGDGKQHLYFDPKTRKRFKAA